MCQGNAIPDSGESLRMPHVAATPTVLLPPKTCRYGAPLCVGAPVSALAAPTPTPAPALQIEAKPLPSAPEAPAPKDPELQGRIEAVRAWLAKVDESLVGKSLVGKSDEGKAKLADLRSGLEILDNAPDDAKLVVEVEGLKGRINAIMDELREKEREEARKAEKARKAEEAAAQKLAPTPSTTPAAPEAIAASAEALQAGATIMVGIDAGQFKKIMSHKGRKVGITGGYQVKVEAPSTTELKVIFVRANSGRPVTEQGLRDAVLAWLNK